DRLALFGEGLQALVAPAGVVREEAAAMGRDDFEIRELIERALLYQVRKRDRRFQRIADHVAQVSVPAQSRLPRPEVVVAVESPRVDEQHGSELLGLRPDDVKDAR